MNLRDLEYLVAVAELKNFSLASVRCHVTQPTLSNQVKKVESYLNTKIFERTNKKVMLTETGKEIITSAKRILREVDTIKEIAEHAQDPLSGTFRLGAFPTLSTYIFPKIAINIKEILPKVRLVLMEEKTAPLIDKLKCGEIDAALLALPVEDEQLVSQTLFEDTFYLAVPSNHPLATRQSISQDELVDQKLLLLEEGHCLRDQALEVCHIMGAAEEQEFRATGLETLRQMVKAGTGITFMPEIAVHKDDTGLRYIPFEDPKPTRTIGLVWRKSSTRTPIIEKLISLIVPA